jgi:hypothetical protein
MQIPYQQNKSTLVQKIAELVEDKVTSFGAYLVAFVLYRDMFISIICCGLLLFGFIHKKPGCRLAG